MKIEKTKPNLVKPVLINVINLGQVLSLTRWIVLTL